MSALSSVTSTLAPALPVRRRPAPLRRRAVTWAYYLGSAVLAVVFLFPPVWTVLSSVHGRDASGRRDGFGFGNYVRVLDYGVGFETYAANSLLVSALTVTGVLLVSTLGGYGFARFRFRGKNVLFMTTLAILMVPYQSILIPLYVLLGWLGLQDSLAGLALVMITLQLPFSLFMMRNSFQALPRELDEAALIDGCTPTTALFRVLLPGVVPGMVTTGLFAFIASWNEFIAPLIFMSTGSKFTLPVALVSMRSGSLGAIDYGALQAGVVLTAIPCVLVFLSLQKYYVRGFTSGALKG